MRRLDFLVLSLAIPAIAACALAYETRDVNVGLFEPGHAAMTLLTKGQIGDPFGLPSGPTAHVSPLPVLFLAGIMWLVGPYDAPARAAISLINGLAYVGCCLLMLRILARLGCARWVAWLAALITILLPLRLYDFQVLYRQWDAIWVNLLLLGGFLVYLRARVAAVGGAWQGAIGLGILAGIAALVSPGAMLAMLALAGLLAWCQPGWASRVCLLVLAGSLCALLIAPWAMRNHAALGTAVPLRSSFGLALAAGNWDGARGTLTNPDYPAFPDRIFGEPDTTALLLRDGEVAHMANLQRKAMAWIAANPGRFLELTVHRAWLSFVPELDHSIWYPAKLEWPRAILTTVLGMGSLAAFTVVLLGWRDPLAWAAVTMLPMAAYVVTSVDERYVTQLFFPRVCLIAFAIEILRNRRAGPRAGLPGRALAL